MGDSASSSSSLLSVSLLAAEFAIQRGDRVETLDGESLGEVAAVLSDAFQVKGRGRAVWVGRESVFWADERGIVLAFGKDEVAENTTLMAPLPDSAAPPPPLLAAP